MKEPARAPSSLIEFDVWIVENDQPRYIRKRGYIADWITDPLNRATTVAIVKDEQGSIHLRNLDDITFIQE